MAANTQIDPIVNLNILGRKQITDLDFQDNFVLAGKDERSLVIKDTDSFVSMSFAKIGTLTKIFLIATPLTTVTTQPEVTLRLTVNNGVDPIYTIDLPFSKIMIYYPSSAFAAFITNINVKTSSTENVRVDVRIYGE